jgi:ribonuclease P protein subunit POP4
VGLCARLGDGANVELAIPKKHTVFRFELEQPAARNPQVEGREVGAGEKLPNLVFEIYGSQFENRAADRATKKFKSKYLADL